ncbi:MAG TPA: NADH-quinone oxidoreductase subunit H, partial [Chitinophagaceae bacterium]|nr:NADH-quinone oxidoreductase subunit H [Chitinophagaceae bacterium]
MWSLENISHTVDSWLYNRFDPTIAMLIEFAIIAVAVIGLFAMLGLVLIMMERKVSAWMQVRLGPNRVGPGGMFQTVADTLKLIVKEGMTPNNVDRFLFNLAPFIVMIVSMVVLAPLMFAKGFQIWDINIG